MLRGVGATQTQDVALELYQGVLPRLVRRPKSGGATCALRSSSRAGPNEVGLTGGLSDGGAELFKGAIRACQADWLGRKRSQATPKKRR